MKDVVEEVADILEKTVLVTIPQKCFRQHAVNVTKHALFHLDRLAPNQYTAALVLA